MSRDRTTKEYNKRRILAIIADNPNGIITTKVATQVKLSHSYSFKLLKELKQENKVTNKLITEYRQHNWLWKLGESVDVLAVKLNRVKKPCTDPTIEHKLWLKQVQEKQKYNPWGQT